MLRAYFRSPDPKGFIVSPNYDNTWFIFSPLFTVLLGMFLSSELCRTPFNVMGLGYFSLTFVLYASLTQGHLTITFLRTHANTQVFKMHPLRFTIVPLGLVGVLLLHPWLWVGAFIFMTFWDVYHSSLQTFGLGRIYDSKAGNDPNAGRRLDIIFNLILYSGPVLAGSVLMDHFRVFLRFRDLENLTLGGTVFETTIFTAIPPYVQEKASFLQTAVIGTAVVFGAYYLWTYYRMWKKGYVISPQKLFMLASTAICSVYAWGYNSMGMGFVIMNIFHAVQYFALVWSTEKRQLCEKVGTDPESNGRIPIVLTFVLLPLCAGFLMSATNHPVAEGILIVCACMHFYYDSFIWSVRKKQHLEVKEAPV